MDFTAMKGYEALRERAAWLDLTARGKIRVTGPDRARLLHAMTTNHAEQLKPGQGCYAFFLNSQGRILGDVNLLCFEDHFLLDTEPETREKLYQHLDHYIIADDVALEDAGARTATLAVEGPAAARVLSELGAPLPEEPFSSAAWGGRIVARLTATGGEGWWIFAPVEDRAELLVGCEPAGDDSARVVRLEHGKPRYGEDITERYLVQETQQLHAVHFTKGCYLGQEIVERVRSRAQIHRLLLPLRIDGATPPPPGSKLTAGDAPAAEITSAAFSPALGCIVALGYVRVQFAGPGTILAWEGARAEVLSAYRPPETRNAPPPH